MIENVERKNKRTLDGLIGNSVIMVQCQLYDISGFEGLEVLKVCMEYQRIYRKLHYHTISYILQIRKACTCNVNLRCLIQNL